MNIYERPTPRTDAIAHPFRQRNDRTYEALLEHAQRLERELETCRDAHMANCLLADTLRREIRELRERHGGDEQR